jgi:uncharacterized protein YcfL
MKKIFILIVIGIFIFAGCQSQNNNKNNNSNKNNDIKYDIMANMDEVFKLKTNQVAKLKDKTVYLKLLSDVKLNDLTAEQMKNFSIEIKYQLTDSGKTYNGSQTFSSTSQEAVRKDDEMPYKVNVKNFADGEVEFTVSKK